MKKIRPAHWGGFSLKNMNKDFTQKVLKIVSQIPKGQVLTYKQVAQKAGSPRAWRAVGNILNRNYRERKWQLPLTETKPIPCHRVIRSDGQIGGYAKGQEAKEKLLKKEGVKINK